MLKGIIYSRNECPLMGTMDVSACSSLDDRSRNSVVHPISRQWSTASRLGLALCQSLPGCGGLSGDALWRGMLHRAWSGSPLSRTPNGCGTPCGAPQGSTSRHKIGTSSGRDAGSAGADFRTTRNPAEDGLPL